MRRSRTGLLLRGLAQAAGELIVRNSDPVAGTSEASARPDTSSATLGYDIEVICRGRRMLCA
jgi:hypothetical protein